MRQRQAASAVQDNGVMKEGPCTAHSPLLQKLSEFDEGLLQSLFQTELHGSGSDITPYRADAPEGWASHVTPTWVYVDPLAFSLPVQGWKVHVSAIEATAHQVLSIVSRTAFQLGIPFKYLGSLAQFRAANSKYADRGSAGKFIALYPRTINELEALLAKLDERIRSFPGPYILSDVQFGSGPVYVRYGAFQDMRSIASDGAELFCILDPAGNLVEDIRSPQFVLPPFVAVPPVLAAAVTERVAPTDSGLEQLLDGLTLERALHFSNGGGVYLLTRDEDGARIVMKEGRTNAGWDFRGVDAFHRVQHEFASLSALAASDLVPQPFDLKIVGDHAFLFEEFIVGDNLHSWVAQNFPYSYKLPTSTYVDQALGILNELIKAISDIHSLGFAVMDLQPTNVIVTPGRKVKVIDLESCCSTVASRADTFIGTPGFVPKEPHSPTQRDEYALLQIALCLFYPLTSLVSISDSVISTLTNLIGSLFPKTVIDVIDRLSADCLDVRQADYLENSPVTSNESNSSAVDLLHRVTEGIHLVRRDRRLDSGEISMYPLPTNRAAESAQVSIEHGLSGVLLALGPGDVNAAEDLSHLVNATKRLKNPRPGFLDGILGVSVVLASRGETDLAYDLQRRHSRIKLSDSNLSIRSGMSGNLFALIRLSDLMGSDDLAEEGRAVAEALVRAVSSPPQELASPGRLAGRAIGLIDGWSGVGMALSMAAHRFGNADYFVAARRAIQHDLSNMVTAIDGSLQADDGFRMLPYVADGSAGLGMALSSIPDTYRYQGDSKLIERVALACRARACISAGLLHGRTGLVLALSSLDTPQVDNEAIEVVVKEQYELLSPFLFRLPTSAGTFVSAENNRQLSVDFGAGASGLAYALRLLTGTSELTGLDSLVNRIGERGRQALNPNGGFNDQSLNLERR